MLVWVAAATIQYGPVASVASFGQYVNKCVVVSFIATVVATWGKKRTDKKR